MNLTITNQTCEDIIFNGHYLEKLYFGNDLVWEKQHGHDYSQDYFTIESLENGNTISLVHYADAPTIDVYYSLDDGTTWTQRTVSGSSMVSSDWILNAGDKLLIKATVNAWADGSDSSDIKTNSFNSTSQFIVYGNIMSLLYGDNFVGKTTLNSVGYNFANLFDLNASRLKNVENLVLPATTLASYCYHDMFASCDAITTAPTLPATTLADNCYNDMFYYCTSLTTSPVLPATTLVEGCYNHMFYLCASLNKVTCLATNISATNCLNKWLTNVSASGTFYKDPSMSSWPSGASGIPSGWTVANAS